MLPTTFDQQTHCVFKAVIFVDVSGAGGQFNPMTQTDPTPLANREFIGLNTVHLPRLIAFIDHRLLSKP